MSRLMAKALEAVEEVEGEEEVAEAATTRRKQIRNYCTKEW